ncbi:MAG: sigma-70 family RNA polymerase sigma factor [Phycisphaeraceae bacterium]|nr:sigma-70 family RNA polymerase sigma factor [Phycisphaeraceae bacterium]
MENSETLSESDRSGLLADLQSDDPQRQNRAAVKLSEMLKRHARRRLGDRARMVNYQLDSVVQTVMVGQIDRMVDRCEDDLHAQRYLREAVRNEIIDRLRKGGRRGEPIQISQLAVEDDSRTPEKVCNQAGPSTRVAAMEALALNQEALAKLRERLLAGLDRVDRILVEHYVLAGESWENASAQAGLSAQAARKRLSRQRNQLLATVVAPLRDRLGDEDWTLIEAIVVQRTPPEKLAAQLGRTVEDIRSRFTRIRDEHLLPTLGAIGCGALLRLMARK